MNTACALLNAPMKDNNKCDETVTPKRTKKVDTEMDADERFGKMLTTQLKKVNEGRLKEKLIMELQKAIFDVLYPEPLVESIPNQYSHISGIRGCAAYMGGCFGLKNLYTWV